MTLEEIQKTLKAPKSQFNSFGKYYYRNCEDILEAVKPLLGDSTLTLSDKMVEIGGRCYVEATARFVGEHTTEVTGYAREALSKKGMDEAQVTGAASSYARKYALNGLFLIDDTKDADNHDNTSSPPVDLDRSGFGKLDYSQMIRGLEECQDLEQLKAVFTKVIKGVGNDKQGQDILTAKKDELKALLQPVI